MLFVDGLSRVKVSHIGRGNGTPLRRLVQAESSGDLWLYTFQQDERACRLNERHGFKTAARGFDPSRQLKDVRYVWERGPSGGQPVA